MLRGSNVPDLMNHVFGKENCVSCTDSFDKSFFGKGGCFLCAKNNSQKVPENVIFVHYEIPISQTETSVQVTSLGSKHNRRHFVYDISIFLVIFLNEDCYMLIQISAGFVPMGSINNNSALVYVMACHWIGDWSLPEPMLTQFTDAYMYVRR